MTPKIAIWAPSHNFVGLYLCNWGIYRQSEKNLLSSNISSTCLHNMVNFGLLAAEIVSGVWGHPSYFQRLPHLGSVTARQSSSERQPNFAALNGGRHLCSAGRPSRWALAHILVVLVVHFYAHGGMHAVEITCVQLCTWWSHSILPQHSRL